MIDRQELVEELGEDKFGRMYERWNKTEDLDSLESAEGLKEGGKILHFGLSFHHEFEVFKDETDSYDKRDRSISHLVKRGHHIT